MPQPMISAPLRARAHRAGAACLLVAAAIASPLAHATDWLMASGYPEDNFMTKNLRQFIAEVGETTSVDIALSPNDTLIKLDAIRTAVQRGQVPIGEIRLGVYGNEDPMFNLEALPFIAPDYASAWELKEAQKDYFDALFGEAGMRVLFYQPWPGQGFYTQAAVDSLDTFEGSKLRVYSPATQKMGEELGFEATILPFAEIPQAFSTGLIEALFTSPQTGIDIQAWDNTDHFTYAGALFSKNAVVVNERAFEALPEEEREALLAAAAAAEQRAWEMSETVTGEQMEILEQNGMTVADAPDDVVERMRDIGQEMMSDWREEASPDAVAVLERFLAD